MNKHRPIYKATKGRKDIDVYGFVKKLIFNDITLKSCLFRWKEKEWEVNLKLKHVWYEGKWRGMKSFKIRHVWNE